ncbi:hypothetical protein ACSBR2_035205 [Camellia fascicularis]
MQFINAYGAALDPRYKMKLIEFCFRKIYNVVESKKHINQIRYSLYELYDDYVVAHASNNIGTSDSQVGRRSSNSPITSCNTKGRAGNLDVDFDALDWWKVNTLKFRILSNMARDLLSIPISTVASESAFNTGDKF